MSRIKVTVSTPSFNVRRRKEKRLKSSVLSGISMARNLSDLRDVDLSDAKNNYVLMFDQASNKYKAYNPDEIFTAATITETTQPGLPLEVLNYLVSALKENSILDDIKLDSLADVDAKNPEDKYLLMYNKMTGEYKLVNPDEVLRASVEDLIEPGLPNEFIDQLDEDLDNKIDFDAGEY